MSGSLEQVSRLLTLVPLLHSRESVRVDEAAALLGVPAAQVRKDLHVLFMCGTPGGMPDDLIDVDVEALDEADGIIRVSNADYLARPLRLTPVEASALLVALRVLREESDAVPAEVVDRTMAKLEAALGSAGGQIAIHDAGDRLERGRTVALAEACERGRQVRLIYHVPARDSETERIVDPHALIEVSGASYLHAWCHRAQAPRLFRLDRIQSLDVLDSSVQTSPDDLPDLSGGFFPADSGAHEVEVVLDAEVAWVPEYYDVEVIDRHHDGSQVIRMRVGDRQWIERLLLRLAPHARVTHPPEFAEAFLSRAQESLSLYT